MVKFNELQVDTLISFKDQKTHTVKFRPDADIKEFDGQRGKYPAVQVLEAGKVTYLPVGSKRLLKKLLEIKEECVVTITQNGSGMQTDYEVKVAGKR